MAESNESQLQSNAVKKCYQQIPASGKLCDVMSDKS